VAFALTALGAALAVALELLEALAIVLAVAVTRRASSAFAGAAAAVLVCVGVGVLLGPPLADKVAIQPLRLIVGIALLLFGMEWLRKGVLRLSGRRARSSSYEEFEEEREALGREDPVGEGFDWPGATVAFKGVLLEGVEVILIVAALAAQPSRRTAAYVGASVAAVAVVALGAFVHRPLRGLPETELKYVVGLMLTTFGTFFCAEGLGYEWPLGDAALLVVLGVWLAWSQALVRVVAR
jgi:uncharacterized membrane protein